ncbi:hypothetical protein CBR_g50024 [Chara braunii]|uniref:Derlin n=1 Tax=Chara braunii TaxID=69332 RepID=A0A388K5L1_CHABU|nr:hypothetical protein CBR_g50024 [Chara braunii]|eukprot:GBG65233.1 hypothetical protein CBR_g50024 [Chara braunii]
MASSPSDWFKSLPPVTKAYGTILVITGVGAYIGQLDPSLLYLNRYLVFKKFQIWRLVTTFCFTAPVSLTLFYDLLMLAWHSVSLEKNTFENRTVDFVYMLLFGMACMLGVGLLVPSLGLYFLSVPLIFMLIYVWARENADANINFMGLFQYKGFYLPWMMLGLSLVFGGRSPVSGLLGILVGHIYYFSTVLYPLAGGRNFLQTPLWVHKLVDKWGVNQVHRQRQFFSPGIAAPRARPGMPAGSQSSDVPPRSSAFSGRSYRLNRD